MPSADPWLREQATLREQHAGVRDGIPTFWVPAEKILETLRYLKHGIDQPYRMLYDLTAIDERWRAHREGQPPSDFTVVYQLYSFDRNAFVRLKTPLVEESLAVPSATGVWPSADWYEREAYDMFGIRFEGHPNLRRILLPPWWTGHPLRKEHPARATEMGPYLEPPERVAAEQKQLQFRPEDYGMALETEGFDYLFLNIGPQHPGTHGPFRIALQLDGEEIVSAVPDIGFHHRAAEKMGERQSWHTYIPYTDRVDYLGGVTNNLAYLTALERLAGIDVPPRAQTIRVMLVELFRIQSHLVWYGTFAQDVGALSPVFYMFVDRDRIFDIVEAICGARMHPGWFRMGGVAADLPRGWDRLVREFLDEFPPRLDEYDRLVMKNRIFRERTIGIGAYDQEQAIDWGVTGPGLRATGLAWDFRKKMPYSGYEQYDFEIPIAQHGDCYDRAAVRVEEIRQSLRIVRQCLVNMPEGPYKSAHPLANPPPKARTMRDIETLIHHFLDVSWGPVIPAGEAFGCIEATKGNNGYYLVSDGGTISYRTRIRTPSFAHLQILPAIARGLMIPDLMTILGATDYVLADVDR
ncbi:MAG: NADH-quinone oxidoreductase subunit C/D [Candidatus Eisenbacteria bacterium]|nr:NADH-quinone oxidoreductase subunit C/D [Candidatus Eisenbacteria bacterium]